MTEMQFYLPFIIFLARVFDVSLGTLRIIFVAKGYKLWAPFVAFTEIIIWIFMISTTLKHLDHWPMAIAYAAGFAAGNYVGMYIEEKLTLGHELIRIITKTDPQDLIEKLKTEGFGLTSIKANGYNGNVGVIYVIIKRNHIKKIQQLILQHNPKALYTVEDIRFVNKQIFFKEPAVHKYRFAFFKKR